MRLNGEVVATAAYKEHLLSELSRTAKERDIWAVANIIKPGNRHPPTNKPLVKRRPY